MRLNPWSLLRVTLFTLAFSLCAVLPSAGQSTFGSITGTVTDPSHAVVPEAQVRVIDEDTGSVRTATTNSSGAYNVSDLNPGTYRVHVEAKGFTVAERAGVALAANQVLDVPIQLTLGTTGTVVQVTGAAPAIDTSTGDLASQKTSRDLASLPIISRQFGDQGFYTLIPYNPGTSFAGNGNSLPNVEGVRQQTGVLPTMDGIAVMSYPIGAGPVQPDQDAIQEVNVQIANAPAEFATASTFSVVTKSGTNQYHGRAFWGWNGDALNARSFFATSVPFRVYNDAGGSIGGPIKKNKVFFFVDYEHSRESAVNTGVDTVPLATWREGNFQDLLPSTVIVNPFTGAPYPNNQITQAINPVSQAVLNLYPLPSPGLSTAQSANLNVTNPGVTGFTNIDQFDTRVDVKITDRDAFFAHASYRRLPLSYNCFWSPIAPEIQLRSGETGVLSWTHTFSPVLLNEFRTGTTRQRNFYEPGTTGQSVIQQLGIAGVSTNPALHGFPAFDFVNINSLDFDQDCDNYVVNLDTNFDWLDNLSWTHGNHFMKFGFSAIRDQRGGSSISSNIWGNYSFDGTFTGFDVADLYLGLPHVTTLGVPPLPLYLHGTTWGVYAEDQYRVTSNLTLNYGVRWELEGAYYDKGGAIYNFDPNNGDLVIPNAGLNQLNPYYPSNITILPASKVAGYPNGPLINTNWKGFYPRVGFAYKPFKGGKTVIRGGYGIYSNIIYAWVGQSMTGGPFAGAATYYNSIVDGAPLFSFPEPFLTTSAPAGVQNVSGVNPRLRTPYTQQWNLTVEHQVRSIGLRASYVGSRSVNLVYQRNLNQPPPSLLPFSNSERPFPTYNNISWYDSGGNDFYGGLQLSATKTYGQNLTFNAGYTWARDLTNTQEGAFAGPQIQNQFDRAVEKGNNGITPTNRWYGYTVYKLPFGRGQRFLSNSNRLENGALGGWNMSWIASYQSGLFFTPSFSTTDPSNTNSFGGRPNRIAGASLYPAQRTINNWFNAVAFAVPGCPDSTPTCADPANVGRFGDAGVNILEGPRIVNADFTLMKYFPIVEQLRLQFRAIMSNAFNHPNFANPNPDISATSEVGVITSQGRANVGEPSPREIVFELRFEF